MLTGGGAPAAGAAIAPVDPRWGALSNGPFRLYISGQLISQSGGWLLRTAQAWLVLQLTNSPEALGLATVIQFLPITILTLFAGVVIDRVELRRMIVLIQVVILIQSAVLGVLVLGGWVQLWHVYVLAGVLGLASAFDFPARASFVSNLVGPSQLRNAIGLNSSVQNGARVLGPGIGGLLIALWGVGWCFVIAAVCYVVVIVSLLALDARKFIPARRAERGGVLRQVGEGIRYSVRDPYLAFPLLLMAFMGTFVYNFNVTLPLLADFALHSGPQGFGNLNVALGLGSIFGALVLASRVNPTARRILIAATILGVLFLLTGLAPNQAAAMGVLLLLGVASIVYSAGTNTLLQIRAREDYRGRVLSVYMLLFAGSTPIGGAISGWMAQEWSIRVAIVSEALVCLAGVVIALVYLRHARARAAREAGPHPQPRQIVT